MKSFQSVHRCVCLPPMVVLNSKLRRIIFAWLLNFGWPLLIFSLKVICINAYKLLINLTKSRQQYPIKEQINENEWKTDWSEPNEAEVMLQKKHLHLFCVSQPVSQRDWVSTPLNAVHNNLPFYNLEIFLISWWWDLLGAL